LAEKLATIFLIFCLEPEICFLAPKVRGDVNSPSPGQNFRKKSVYSKVIKFSIQKPKNIPSSTKTKGGDVIQSYQLSSL